MKVSITPSITLKFFTSPRTVLGLVLFFYDRSDSRWLTNIQKKSKAILGKIAGDAIWSVIGEDMSMREFAQRQATSGRPISVNEVKGRVISGLDILADHYRI